MKLIKDGQEKNLSSEKSIAAAKAAGWREEIIEVEAPQKENKPKKKKAK